jgi:hypothetical protein
MNILRVLNTILLAGILATLVLIRLRLGQPVKVNEPVAIQGWDSRGRNIDEPEPVSVSIDNAYPIEVQIAPRQ